MKRHAPALHLVSPPATAATPPGGRAAGFSDDGLDGDGLSDGLSDDVLMLAAAGGDQAAFAELVRRYEPTIRRLCRVMLASDDAARDMSQEVFLRAWRHRGRFDARGRARPFLLTIARNRCRDQLRKRRVRRLFAGRQEAAERLAQSEILSPDARLTARHERAAVLTALEQLPEKFRVPLVLRFVDELPYDDIATIIDRTPSTARSRVHYGLRALRQRLPAEVTPW